jgi:hypothetical protein
MMSKRAWATKAVLATALLVGMGIGTGAYAVFFDSFDAGNLNQWTVSGDATAVAPGEAGTPYAAQLADGSGDASMFTAFTVNPATNHYQFDFNVTGLSSFVPDGGFPDYFSATLYFSDTLPTSLDGLEGLALMDANYTLVKNTGTTGVPGQSYIGGTIAGKGDDWYRYAVDYTVPINPLTGLEYLYAIPVFDLRSTNGVGGDSSVLIDNVTPEPITMVMLGCLGAGMVAARKLRRK